MMLAASLLSGCLGLNSGEPAILPPSLTKGCSRPVALPERGLTDTEIEILWGRDRGALRACGDRHGALAVAVSQGD
jgi:hypothetical protein